MKQATEKAWVPISEPFTSTCCTVALRGGEDFVFLFCLQRYQLLSGLFAGNSIWEIGTYFQRKFLLFLCPTLLSNACCTCSDAVTVTGLCLCEGRGIPCDGSQGPWEPLGWVLNGFASSASPPPPQCSQLPCWHPSRAMAADTATRVSRRLVTANCHKERNKWH